MHDYCSKKVKGIEVTSKEARKNKRGGTRQGTNVETRTLADKEVKTELK